MSEKGKTKEKEEIKLNLRAVILITMILVLIIIVLLYNYFNEMKKIKSNDDNLSIKSAIKIEEFDNEKAIKLLKQYLEEKALAYSNPQALLEKYSFATNQEFASYKKTTDEKFLRTDIIYEDIRSEMNKYITKDFFTKEFKNIYKSSNGITHVAIINSPKENYNITRYELLESNTKEILNVWYTITKEDIKSEEKNMQVEFSKINGNWIISNIK